MQPNAPGTQGYNRYSYTANNPATWTDPSGHAVGGSEGGTGSATSIESPRLLENWLEIGLALAEPYVAECAARSPGGVCFPISAQLIRIFVVVACVLEWGGPCWGTTSHRIAKEPPGGGASPPAIPEDDKDFLDRLVCWVLEDLGKEVDGCRWVIPKDVKELGTGKWGIPFLEALIEPNLEFGVQESDPARPPVTPYNDYGLQSMRSHNDTLHNRRGIHRAS